MIKKTLGLGLLAALFLYGASAMAAITAVGSAASGVGVVSVTPTVGNMLVATIRVVTNAQNTGAVTDSSGGNVWHRAVSCSNGAIDNDEIWYATGVAGGTYNVSFSNNVTLQPVPGTVTEWAGAMGLSSTGACGTGITTTTVLGGAITPPNNTDLVVEDWASATASSTQSSRTCPSCTSTPSTWTQIAAATTGPSGESARIILTTSGLVQYQITTATAVTYGASEASFAAVPAAPTPSVTITPTPIASNSVTPTPTAVPSGTPTVSPTPEPTAVTSLVNERGYAGVPISVPACSSGTDIVLLGRRSRVTWSIMPEGADVRCETGTSGNGGPIVTPSATVGFLFKSDVLVPEQTLNLGTSGATLRLDCCGVSGAVPIDTWEEGPAPTRVPTQTPTQTPAPTATPT